jgi:hypothetical protein
MLPRRSAGPSILDSTPEYLRRMTHIKQMDLEYTLWQMTYFVINPSKAYRMVVYHAQTKRHWARDDPAFVVVQIMLLLVTAIAYSIAFYPSEGWGIFGALLNCLHFAFVSIIFHYIVFGVIIATISWIITNAVLHAGQNDPGRGATWPVEWLYCWDVHCNSFFPHFILLYVLQYVMMYIVLSRSVVSTLIANTITFVAFSYYHYVSFLGYAALPALQGSRTEPLLVFPVLFWAFISLMFTLLNANMTWIAVFYLL